MEPVSEIYQDQDSPSYYNKTESPRWCCFSGFETQNPNFNFNLTCDYSLIESLQNCNLSSTTQKVSTLEATGGCGLTGGMQQLNVFSSLDYSTNEMKDCEVSSENSDTVLGWFEENDLSPQTIKSQEKTPSVSSIQKKSSHSLKKKTRVLRRIISRRGEKHERKKGKKSFEASKGKKKKKKPDEDSNELD